MFLQQFAALHRRPAHHFTERAKAALEAYPWPGNVRELQNLVMTSVLFCDGPEVDVEDLQGFHASLDRVPAAGPPVMSTPPAGDYAPIPAGDPMTRLRAALSLEVAAAVSGGPAALVPLGKWLAEDLILAADRLAGGGTRRGADLLGLPETTYRRQLRAATARRDAGGTARSPTWTRVASLLEDVIRARPDGVDACQWAEAGLLGEIESTVKDARRAAHLLGVTEPTLHRRRAELLRQS
jgi:DNA-binding NtrC family response regulator